MCDDNVLNMHEVFFRAEIFLERYAPVFDARADLGVHCRAGFAQITAAEMMPTTATIRPVVLLVALALAPASLGDVLNAGLYVLVSNQQARHTTAGLLDDSEALFL